MNEINSLTHSCMHSLASFAILAFSGSAVFMIRATIVRVLTSVPALHYVIMIDSSLGQGICKEYFPRICFQNATGPTANVIRHRKVGNNRMCFDSMPAATNNAKTSSVDENSAKKGHVKCAL
jgi:hypothetical protein